MMPPCRVCGADAPTTNNAYEPICPSCRTARNREINRLYYHAHKSEIMEREKRNRIKKKTEYEIKIGEGRRRYVMPKHGVQVIQYGCRCPDTYSKNEFFKWLKAGEFPVGTEYWLDGERHVVCNGQQTGV